MKWVGFNLKIHKWAFRNFEVILTDNNQQNKLKNPSTGPNQQSNGEPEN